MSNPRIVGRYYMGKVLMWGAKVKMAQLLMILIFVFNMQSGLKIMNDKKLIGDS